MHCVVYVMMCLYLLFATPVAHCLVVRHIGPVEQSLSVIRLSPAVHIFDTTFVYVVAESDSRPRSCRFRRCSWWARVVVILLCLLADCDVAVTIGLCDQKLCSANMVRKE
jgi:hypothetical protein